MGWLCDYVPTRSPRTSKKFNSNLKDGKIWFSKFISCWPIQEVSLIFFLSLTRQGKWQSKSSQVKKVFFHANFPSKILIAPQSMKKIDFTYDLSWKKEAVLHVEIGVELWTKSDFALFPFKNYQPSLATQKCICFNYITQFFLGYTRTFKKVTNIKNRESYLVKVCGWVMLMNKWIRSRAYVSIYSWHGSTRESFSSSMWQVEVSLSYLTLTHLTLSYPPPLWLLKLQCKQ